MKKKVIFILLTFFLTNSFAEYEKTRSEEQIPALSNIEIDDLLKSNQIAEIVRHAKYHPTPSFTETSNLRSPGDAARIARESHSTAPVSRGKAGEKYDVIIQIGHYPRVHGKTGGQGKLVNEQQAAALIAVGLINELGKLRINEKPIKTLLIGADDYEFGLDTKIFLALHTDATNNACTVGPSVGYEDSGDASGMNNIALALALTLDIDAKDFMKNNYTKNLSGYYAYRTIKSSKFKGLLEMSELTCPPQEENLLKHSQILPSSLAKAIQFALR